MEKNIKEIKETIKADFVNSRAIIKNYETSDGTIYMKKTIDYFNIGIMDNYGSLIMANDLDYSLTEDFETAWSDMVKNYSDYEVERLRKEIENKWL